MCRYCTRNRLHGKEVRAENVLSLPTEEVIKNEIVLPSTTEEETITEVVHTLPLSTERYVKVESALPLQTEEVAKTETALPLLTVQVSHTLTPYMSTTDPIPLESFRDHVQIMHANNNYLFFEEYNVSMEMRYHETTNNIIQLNCICIYNNDGFCVIVVVAEY